jgi:hypothetical protein
MTQQRTAKVAGLLYLVTMIIPLLAEIYLRGPLINHGDAAQTSRNIVASQWQFRMSIASGLVAVAIEVILLVALYVVLESSNRNLAFLAAFWRLIKCAIFALMALNDFVVLSLLSGAEYLRAFQTSQLQALAAMFLSVRHDAGLIGGVFLGLGSTVFAYLWLSSRYIPRLLAAWGIFASLALAIGILLIMAYPGLRSVIGPAYWAPLFIFEVTLGVWLLVKGIRAPVVEQK